MVRLCGVSFVVWMVLGSLSFSMQVPVAPSGQSMGQGPAGTGGDRPLMPLERFSGPVDVAVDVVAYPGVANGAGTFSLSGLPADAAIQRAWLFVTAFELQRNRRVSAIFNQSLLQGRTPDHRDTGDGLTCCTWRFDVTSLVSGNGDYAYSSSGANFQYGDALVVVYAHPSLPMQTVVVHDGAESLRNATTTTSFGSLGDLGSYGATLTLFTSADDGSSTGDDVSVNGVSWGSNLFDENQGPYASLVELTGTIQTSQALVEVTTAGDWFGLHLGVLEVPGGSELPSDGLLASVERDALFSMGVFRGDVFHFDTATGEITMVLDLSDVGPWTGDIDALSVLSDGSLVVSFRHGVLLPGLIGGPRGDRVEKQDVVRFKPLSLGEETSGYWEFYFDGSDQRLTSNKGNVDALHAVDLEPGVADLLFSTRGTVTLLGGLRMRDEDIVLYSGPPGHNSHGTTTLVFDLSEPWANIDDDVDGVTVTDSELFITARGVYLLPDGTRIESADVARHDFGVGAWDRFHDGSTFGYTMNIDALHVLGR